MTSNASAEVPPAMRALGSLVGTWRYGGELRGETTFAWLPGGQVLLQVGTLTLAGATLRSHEVIGHMKPFMGEQATEVTSRAYTDTGDTLDYTWELGGDVLTIWGGERDSPAYCQATISADGNAMSGAWHWPGGGYSYTAERVEG